MYNALQVTVNKPMGHDVSVLGTFTWNHEMDSTQYLNATDPDPERCQDGSPTLLGNLAVIYQLPVFSAMPRYGREILGGWQANGILRASERPPGGQSEQRYLAFQPQAGQPDISTLLQHLLLECGGTDGHDKRYRAGLRQYLVRAGIPAA